MTLARSAVAAVVSALVCSSTSGHETHKEEFDFVIVGGGLAGSILANRLSESGRHSVLLLNIAGAPPGAYAGPVMVTDEFIVHRNMSADDGLRARIMQPGYEPMPAFSTAETGSSPARWLGGSSLVQLSLYLRDHPEALDSWGSEWRWPHARKYYNRVEDGSAIHDGDYGQHGAFKITGKPAYVHSLSRDFIAAAHAAGLPQVGDLNTQKGAGVGLTPVSQHEDGTKMHAYNAFLKPAVDRKNLVVRSGSRADRLIIDEGHRCRGVAYRVLAEDADRVVFAKREVVLTSGYIYSPRLLFLSGIGDKKELKSVGLEVKKDLPAVGRHLTAARYTPLAWHTEEPTLSQMMGQPISPKRFAPVPEAYGSAVLEATARFRSQAAKAAEPDAERPDVAVMFMPLYYAPKSAPLQYSLQGEEWPLKTNAYTLLVTLGETKAKGSVTFPSASPDVSPVVTHDALSDPYDLAVAKEAVAWARRVGSSSKFNRTTGAVDNGAGAASMFSAVYDGRGTCRMGNSDKRSVVDRNLRVHGIEGLRIADGSVIPKASPYLAVPEVLLVAERAAELILHEHLGFDEKAAEKDKESLPAESAATWPIAKLTAKVGTRMTLLEAVYYLGTPGPLSLSGATASEEAAPNVGTLALAAAACVAGGAVLAAAVLMRKPPLPEARDAHSLYAPLA